MNRQGRATPLASIRQMCGQVSRGSVAEYQADERAEVARLRWRVDYLFGNHVLYYSWCDEGGMECPESIEEALHRFAEYERSGEEMKIHYDR